MKRSIKPSAVSGKIAAPPSKSVTQRAVAAALLDRNPSALQGISLCDDALASLRVAEGLGARIALHKDTATIEGGLHPSAGTLHCGEAGLCIRMFTPIASLAGQKLTLTGSGSLLSRPLGAIETSLRELGVKCKTRDGFPPIQVEGPLQGGRTIVDGRLSSQFLTGLLLALPTVSRDSQLAVIDLKSKAYIDITLTMLRDFGVHIEHTNYTDFFIQGEQTYSVREYRIEGDWSGASFLLVAGAIAGDLAVSGLTVTSPQADRKIIAALEAAGAHIGTVQDTVSVKGGEMRGFDFDATDCPDLFPPLVALACNCRGTSSITGVERLRHKESDRALALLREFRTLGAEITVVENKMIVEGTVLYGGNVNSHYDHRIAMALAVAALTARDRVTIENAECVTKSYPHFFEDFAAIGGEVYE